MIHGGLRYLAQGDLALANAFAAAGDAVSAVVYYQRVYYAFPMSLEAAQAEAESDKLRSQLGDSYPPPMPSAMLGRALKLLNAGRPDSARKELEALVPQLGGAEKDLARVRIGVAGYNSKETAAAHRYLASLEVSAPEADAERLYYLLLSARRLNNQEEVNETLDRMARLYPNSRWRLDALVASANHYLIENQMEAYEPLYRACYETFPQDPQAYASLAIVLAVGGHPKDDVDRVMDAMFHASPGPPSALLAARTLEFLGEPEAARRWRRRGSGGSSQ